MVDPNKVKEITKEKAALTHFQDPDTGTAGRRFNTLSEGIVENLVPGVTGRFNLFTHSQQSALDSYEPTRLDDGVSGEHRMARVVYYEVLPIENVQHASVVAELIAMQPEDQPVSEIGEVLIVSCATAGGATAMLVVPDENDGDAADLTRILRYPKFYALLGSNTSVPEPILNGLCWIEYRDLEEYSFGIFKGMVGDNESVGLSGGRGADGGTSAAEVKGKLKDKFLGGKPPGLGIKRSGYDNLDAYRRAKLKKAGDYLVSPEIIQANPPSSAGSTDFIGIAGMDEHGIRRKELRPERLECDFDPKSGVSEAKFFGYGKSSKYKGHGMGNTKYIHLRKDCMEYLKRAKKEINDLGGYLATAGGCPGIRRTTGVLIADQHRLGTAFDLSIALGHHPKGFQKTGGSSKRTPRYIHVRLGPHSRRHKVMCRVDDDHPAASQHSVGTHLHQKLQWNKKLEVIEVTGRYFDLTAILAKYGFTTIGGYRNFYYRHTNGGKFRKGQPWVDQGGHKLGDVCYHPNSKEHEWWHFQFDSQFIYGKTNYLDELVRSYRIEDIQKNFKRYDKISRKAGWIYGVNWG